MIEKLLEPLVSERFRNEEKYRLGHTRILNPLPGRAVMGLHIPDMRKVAKTLAVREDASTIIADFGKEAEKGREALAHEELMVWGMMINFIKGTAEEKLAMLEKFVPQIDNWGVCDSVSPGARWFRKADKAWDILCRYFASDREFEVRFATVMSMCHFMDERYLPRIFWQFDTLDFNRIQSDYLGPSETRAAGGPEKVLSSGRGVVIGESPLRRLPSSLTIPGLISGIPVCLKMYCACMPARPGNPSVRVTFPRSEYCMSELLRDFFSGNPEKTHISCNNFIPASV